MYTVQKIFDLSMDLINKRLATGQIATNTAQYKARTPGILDIWQKENSKNGDYFETYEISHKPIPLAKGMSGFDMIEYIGEELTFEAQEKAYAYYFEVDGPCTVYVEDYTDDWNVLATINVLMTDNSFTDFKGIFTPTVNATKTRLRFTGTYYYRIQNKALFNIPFSPNRVPDYRAWVKYEMPDNFKSIDAIIEESFDGAYSKDAAFKWESLKDLYVNYNFEGNIRIKYKPVPPQLTSLNDTLKIDDVTAMSGAYFLAAHLLLVEDPDSANYFSQRYSELKFESATKRPRFEEDIVDVYGGV